MIASKKLKVLLITPPYHSGVVESAGVWMPVALVYLAGMLRKHGHEPVIYDAMSYFHDHARIKQELVEQAPDMVALTAITASVNDCLGVCRSAKEVNPNIVTIIGNQHGTYMWRQMLNENPELDLVARGEGDFTIGDLADVLGSGGALSSVAGIAYRENGVPTSTPPRGLTQDLDELPMAWDLIDWPTYTYRPRPGSTLAVVSSSRGCMQECSFCSQQLFWRKTWRGRSPENFVAELQTLATEFGVTVAMLSDETPTTDPVRWERILDLLIERQVGVELLMETRVDDILRDEAILHKYAKAGISHIYVGVESTIQSTLDTFKKKITVEQSKRAIELINQHGIVSETSFVLGMPDETPERMRQTIELAKHYGPDLAIFLAITPWPYSQLYDQLKDHIEVTDFSRYNLVEAVLKPDAMTVDEVTKMLGVASHQFYADKLSRLDELTPAKREFMVKVTRILMKHSYLAAQMQGLTSHMPDFVKKMLTAMDAAEEALEASHS